MAYEETHPVEGGPRTLVDHTGERCEFHPFRTPAPGRHILPATPSGATRT